MKVKKEEMLLKEYRAELSALEQTEDSCKKELLELENALTDISKILGDFSFSNRDTRIGCDIPELALIEGEENSHMNNIFKSVEQKKEDLLVTLKNIESQKETCKKRYQHNINKMDDEAEKRGIW